MSKVSINGNAMSEVFVIVERAPYDIETYTEEDMMFFRTREEAEEFAARSTEEAKREFDAATTYKRPFSTTFAVRPLLLADGEHGDTVFAIVHAWNDDAGVTEVLDAYATREEAEAKFAELTEEGFFEDMSFGEVAELRFGMDIRLVDARA